MNRIHQLDKYDYITLTEFFGPYQPFTEYYFHDEPNLNIDVIFRKWAIDIRTGDQFLDTRLQEILDHDENDLMIHIDLDKKIFSLMYKNDEFFRASFSSYILGNIDRNH
jgi:hypothetical protein